MEDLNNKLFDGLPDKPSAQRFISRFREGSPREYSRLSRNQGLFSDVLTLAAYSPLLAATLQQNPGYIPWLEKARKENVVATKDELLESLARFSLTHSDLDTHALLARFRRRELLRIYLRDIRRLATVSEITQEISDLADAILEYALRDARRELDNAYGIPLESDEKGRSKRSDFCVVSLGKLGSKELNYASDIDLLFIYSAEGTTSGQGERGALSNREYFVKLSQKLIRIVGEQSGEGAAYRVDLRLRPHGSIGPPAQCLADTVRYYRTEARPWEMQVLIRSRSSAGDASMYNSFFRQVEDRVFSREMSPDAAIGQVREAKKRINLENKQERGINVKLGRGGIREIEFIAQGLQLAHGGRDKWLRVSHTLISLSRLADRRHITENELTETAAAYEFLRRLEHVLQMENGLQTHTVPRDLDQRTMVSARMNCSDVESFDSELAAHTANVNRIFTRIYGEVPIEIADEDATASSRPAPTIHPAIENIRQTSPRFAAGIMADDDLTRSLNDSGNIAESVDHSALLTAAIRAAPDHSSRLSALRRTWSSQYLRIAASELTGHIDMPESKHRQTRLAEASLDAAIEIARLEMERRYKVSIPSLGLGILALGKLGGGAVDYDSDLDVVFVFGESETPPVADVTAAEFYSRASESVVNALSSVTRDGSLYRVDLRLRPYGKNGPLAISDAAFRDYLSTKADVWELLAFVKLRAVGSQNSFAVNVENDLRSVIHERAAGTDPEILRSQAADIRYKLEARRSARRSDVDIKYGPGGMLDVYFVTRYLQLRDNIRDAEGRRSTRDLLAALHQNASLSDEHHEALSGGYRFLAALDHNIRLTIGRSTRLPQAGNRALAVIAERMQLSSQAQLNEELTLHRIRIRQAFEQILGTQ